MDTTTTYAHDLTIASLAQQLVSQQGGATAHGDRQQLHTLLTVRPASIELPLDELARKTLVSSQSIPRCSENKEHSLGKISLWRGDVTCLQCDAIVNAANSAMCGCFDPSHRCIDNVLHAAAGPRMRAACHALMMAQGHAEGVGQCKITPAFNLPSKFVLHTVGPQLRPGDAPTLEQAAQLGACYTSCLDAAANTGVITSVAFCSISTGLFGYPHVDAAHSAIQAVTRWLDTHADSSIQHVIFDVFTDADEQAYIDLFKRFAC
jgi:O-acetyl-ADP-ribose deacetylase (regulator of RNase III)